MKTDITISVRDILTDNSKCWRVIFVDTTKVVLCQIDTTKMNIVTIDLNTIILELEAGSITKQNDIPTIVDKDDLPEYVREKFDLQTKIVNEVTSAYGPTYESLMNRKPKPLLTELMRKYDISRPTLLKIIRQYLQSGMQEHSLVDNRIKGNSAPPRKYTKLQGATSLTGTHKGRLLTEADYQHFDEAIRKRTQTGGKARGKTWKRCFEDMLSKYYSDNIQLNSDSVMHGLRDDIPSYDQFYYYVRHNASQKAIDIADTSAFEQLNDKRLRTGSAKTGLVGPGDVFEIDACEIDAALVSVWNPSLAVGRPILYVMVDVYTSMIVAISVAFDNNSVVGLTNVFANLAQDKQEFASSYGITFDNPDIWPTGFKPNTIRVDHGSDFISTDIHRIAKELGIDIDTVPVMAGSMKGTVEHIFRMIHQKTGVDLIMKGKIEKRFDSKHHEKAVLNIEDFTKIVIGYVLYHNTKYYPDKLKSSDQIEAGVQSIPAALWKYYCEKFQSPRLLPSKDQFLYSLMIPAKGTISGKIPGIELQGLYFDCDLPEIEEKRYKLQRRTTKIDVRYDPRDTSQIYLLDKNKKLQICPLNGRIPENKSYLSMTWKRYHELRQEGKKMDVNAERYQLEHSIAMNELTDGVVREAESRRSRKSSVKTDDIRSQRKKEKERISTQHSFREQFDLNIEPKTSEESVSTEKPKLIKEPPAQSETKKPVPYSHTTMKERHDDVAHDFLDLLDDF